MVGGRYELRSAIGKGGCAVVYDAVDLRVGRQVAVKIARPRAIEGSGGIRLAREARVGASIHHPNVCSVLDGGCLDDGRPYIVMERLYGETLTSVLARDGRMAPADAIDLALQLLSALDAAHAQRVIHRDVKPCNVFLVPRAGCTPLVKLLDFGLCVSASQRPQSNEELTRAGHAVGTPEYMSPEQIRGSRRFDAQIDVYAVGVILYEALSGRRAFSGPDIRSVVLSVISKRPSALRVHRPDLPVLLEQTVMRAMDVDLDARYQTAAEMQTDLLEAHASVMRRQLGLPASPVSETVLKGAGSCSDLEMPTRPTLQPSSRWARRTRLA